MEDAFELLGENFFYQNLNGKFGFKKIGTETLRLVLCLNVFCPEFSNVGPVHFNSTYR